MSSHSCFSCTISSVVNICVGQVPFTDVLELVRGLKVFVRDGFAYVPQNEFVVIVVNVFRSRLSHALVVSVIAFTQKP